MKEQINYKEKLYKQVVINGKYERGRWWRSLRIFSEV